MSKSQAMPFVILASGTGTNARVLLKYAKEHSDLLQAVALISDRAEAPALEIAKEFGVRTYVVSHKNETALLALLQKLQPEWACLAGYMRVVGKNFLDFFWSKELGFSRVMNVHPSLLPAFPGLHAYEQAFRAGVKVAGVTVHLVDSGVDTGKPILQEIFFRGETDNLRKFEQKGRHIEYKLFPKALKLAALGKISLRKKDDSEFVSLE